MSAAQSNLDASQLLHDDDCQIIDEYDAVVEGALDMRRKFTAMVHQARQLEAKLQEKGAEIDHLASRYRQMLSEHENSSRIAQSQLRRQGRALLRYRCENQSLRRRNQQTEQELEDARRELDQVNHLRCDICRDTFKNAVTPCGHTFCRTCLITWISLKYTCPNCRKGLEKSDIKDIYHDSDSSDVLDYDATEVLSVSSDAQEP